MAEDLSSTPSPSVIDQAMHQSANLGPPLVAHGQGELRLLIVGIGSDAADGVSRLRPGCRVPQPRHLAVAVDLVSRAAAWWVNSLSGAKKEGAPFQRSLEPRDKGRLVFRADWAQPQATTVGEETSSSSSKQV